MHRPASSDRPSHEAGIANQAPRGAPFIFLDPKPVPTATLGNGCANVSRTPLVRHGLSFMVPSCWSYPV